MNVKIQFNDNFEEKTIPIIQLTKSKNGKTGTATFIFVEPRLFQHADFLSFFIEDLSLVWNNQKITTHDIQFFFKNGQPFLIKGIFIFKNAREWFDFLNFMTHYSRETGLSFSETNSSFKI
jgi:photosystem II protein